MLLDPKERKRRAYRRAMKNKQIKNNTRNENATYNNLIIYSYIHMVT